MGSEFIHVLMTRFNVRINWPHAFRGLDESWLKERFELFERYCLPSIKAQTCQDFHWLVFFDTATPHSFRQRIAQYSGDLACFVPCFVDFFDRTVFRDIVASMELTRKRWIITSRVDNDDALARNYIERVQAQFTGQEREFINFQNGLVLRGTRLYLSSNSSGHFPSLIEKSTDPLTVYVRHTEMKNYAPVRQVGGEPGWLEVRHPGRLTEKGLCPNCKPVPMSRYAQLFPAVRDLATCNPIMDYVTVALETVAYILKRSRRFVKRRLYR